MYQPLAAAFKKESPISEIHPPAIPKAESEYYFQLLSDYGIKLNEPQKDAVRAVEGPVCVIAGAGSGKTTVLTSRIGYMIHTKKITPANILLVTYTKKASTEMIERLVRIPGIDRTSSRSVVAGTYHSICLRILRAEGYNFRVLASERKQHYMIKAILKKMQRQDDYSAETVANVISVWKNNMIRPEDVQGQSMVELELKEVYQRYENIKEDENLYDFDDLLLECYFLLKFRTDILEKYQRQYQYILCDEFQDTSSVQYKIIQMLAKPKNNLCIVGDDCQTIYSYRSASASYMVNFDKQYPNCKKIIMDINYRSGPAVVGLGNAIIKYNKHQIKKTLKAAKAENYDVQFANPRDSDQEAEWIVQDIREKYAAGLALKDMAVLYRTHSTGRAVFDKLLMEEIPFVTYGKSNESFYNNSFIKPLLSLLRISTNFMDVDAMIDAAPMLYISRNEMQSTIDQISMSYIGETPRDLFVQVIKKIAEQKSGFQQRALLTKLDCIKSLSKMTTPQAIREVRKGKIDYEKHLELDERKTFSIHKEMLLEILDECEQASRGFETIESFLSFIERVEEKNGEMEDLRKHPEIEAVRLMTIHASKGLEFDVVYAIGWSESILPHASSLDTNKKEDSQLEPEKALDEERRLGYVCVTRARKHLYLSSPKSHRGNEVKVSRFLHESLGIQDIKGEKAYA